MERAPNAKGHAGSAACAHKPSSPNTSPSASREKSLMNNLKVLNSISRGLQETSEDPLEFIYPTCRAAQTETHIDKPPWKGSHQEVAYVSSAVGGSV
jgi:hypothetical protein